MASRLRRLPYVPGLDGLRAVAVVAVLLYHAELQWAPSRFPGGFLGVEVFFVLSGYLITSILLGQQYELGRVDLKGFWLNRARRLLPAVFVLLVAVLAYATVFLPDEVASLRADSAAAFGYITNWYLLFDQQSYFESLGRPRLLLHLWSLAIEEQFYLVWPLLFVAGMKLLGRRQMLFCVLVASAASTALMAALYHAGVDPSRLYFGTDTRAAGPLMGAALAFVWAPGQILAGGSRVRTLALDVAGLVALAALVYFFLTLGEDSALLYRGGFAIVGLATCVVIAAVTHPHGRIGTLLGRQPLHWIGLRSYSIYLWHWPVFMLTRPQVDIPMDGPELLALRLAITGVLAELSYRLVETPVRRGALGRAWDSLRAWRAAETSRLSLRWAGAAGAAVSLTVLLGLFVATAGQPAPPHYLSTQKIEIVPVGNADGPTGYTAGPERTPTDTGSSVPEPPLLTAEPQPTAPAPPADPPAAFPDPPLRVTAIGDSVMLGAATSLSVSAEDVYVYAQVGLQVDAGIDILRNRKSTGDLGDIVVVHLGNNGVFSADQFAETMQLLAEVDRVVFVNLKIPRAWEDPINAMLAENVGRYENAVLVDWHGASVDEDQYFGDDGMHLRPEGAAAYAGLIGEQY